MAEELLGGKRGVEAFELPLEPLVVLPAGAFAEPEDALLDEPRPEKALPIPPLDAEEPSPPLRLKIVAKGLAGLYFPLRSPRCPTCWKS